MTLPGMELAAQIAIERVLNSLPEGLLLAAGAWALLRVMGRQNAGTRFAVWMVALAGIVLLPWIDGFHGLVGHALVGHALAGFGAAHTASNPAANIALAIPGLWALIFFLLWMAAAIALLARLAAGIWQVKTIRGSCVEIPLADLPPALQEPIRHSSRHVRILASTEARVPAAIGLGHAAIVLPAWALDELSPENLRAVLIHELTHLERRDDWTNLLQKAVRAVLFFHPAVWWIESRLSMEREMACDDAVLAATGNPRAYAGCLIGLLERGCARRGWTLAQAAVARARDAAQRIAQILHPGRSASVRMGRLAPAIAAGFSAACVAIALCAPQWIVIGPDEPTSATAAPAPAEAAAARPILAATARPAQPAVIPASFAIQHRLNARRHHIRQQQAAVIPAVLPAVRMAAPQVQLASAHLRQPAHAAIAPAAQWTLVETAVYSRTVAAGPSRPLIIQTVTWQTVRLASRPTQAQPAAAGQAATARTSAEPIEVRRLEVVQIVWTAPAQVIAQEAASSKSI